jgi:hypothetical protein
LLTNVDQYLAVGCFDNTVLLLAVDDPSDPLRQLTIQAVGEEISHCRS